MPLIYLETFIKAPQQRVFDISRSIDVHRSSMQQYKEEPVAGQTTGLMNEGDTVTWVARHLFKTRKLQVQMTVVKPYEFFCDEMLNGDFKQMKHEHFFKALQEGTRMIDQFYFTSPFGWLGKLVNALFLERYMKRLLIERNKALKQIAESNQWEQFFNH